MKFHGNAIPAWIKRRVFDPFLALLAQGITPEKLAQCVAVGLVVGVFPVLGCTTAIAAGAAFAFRLNMVAIQTINYFAYPLWFALLIPFYKAGSFLFRDRPLSLSANDVISRFKSAPMEALRQLGVATWHAIVAWGITAFVAIPLLIVILRPIFRRARLSFGDAANKGQAPNLRRDPAD